MGGFSRELCETDHLQYHKLLRKACVAVGSVTSNCIAAPGRGPFHEHWIWQAGSREQGAGSREQGAGSREQGAGSREQGAGRQGAGGRGQGAGGRGQGAGGRGQGQGHAARLRSLLGARCAPGVLRCGSAIVSLEAPRLSFRV